jgi:hypothetical protein
MLVFTLRKGGGRFRLAYVSHTIRVTPLFNVRWLTRPSFAEVKETILGLEVEDRQTETRIPSTIQLSQVSVFSQTWAISPLVSSLTPAAAATPSVVMMDQKEGKSNNGLMMGGGDSDPFASPRSIAGSLPLATPSNAMSSCLLAPGEASTIFFRVANIPGSIPTPSPSAPSTPRGGTSSTSSTTPSTPVLTSSSSSSSAAGGPDLLSIPPSLMSSLPISPRGAPAVDNGQHSSVSFTTTGVTTYPCTAPPLFKLLRMEKDLMIHQEKSLLIVNPSAIVDNVAAPDRMDFVLAWTADNGHRWGTL